MKADLITRTQYLVKCPHCQAQEFEITHLIEMAPYKFGTWYCDSCGGGIKGKLSIESKE